MHADAIMHLVICILYFSDDERSVLLLLECQ